MADDPAAPLVIERPAGGLSFVLSDGQTSGKPAKAISNVVTRKAISLLADGVRDGPAARAASDYLYTYRSGKVLATLNILSVDLQSQTLVITRNNPVPVILMHSGTAHALTEASEAVGTRRGIRPSITEVPLAPGLAAIMYTDGLTHAGARVGTPMDVLEEVRRLAELIAELRGVGVLGLPAHQPRPVGEQRLVNDLHPVTPACPPIT